MILEGKTARPLGRRALVIVLGVGAVLLMLTPGGAEPPPATGPLAAPQNDSPRPPAPPIAAHFSAAGEFSLENQPRPDANRLIAAQEEVELLEAKLAVKEAQVAAARVAVDGARPALARAEAMFKRNVNGAEDLEKARMEVQTREMEVAIRQAETREPAVRLRQARRRLAALQADAARENKDAKPGELRRLNDMQKKVDDLRREIESLRKGLQPSSSARPSDAGAVPVLYSLQRAVEIPNPLTREQQEARERGHAVRLGGRGKKLGFSISVKTRTRSLPLQRPG